MRRENTEAPAQIIIVFLIRLIISKRVLLVSFLFVKNPERAVKNAVYHRATVGVGDIIDGSHSDADVPIAPSGLFIFLIMVGIILAVMSLILTLVYPVLGIIGIIGGIACAVYGRKKLKEFKQ